MTEEEAAPEVDDRIEVVQEVFDCMEKLPVDVPFDTGRLTHVKLAASARSNFEKNARVGRLTHACIIEAAAMQALATTDLAELRTLLVKLAAAALNAVEHIDSH